MSQKGRCLTWKSPDGWITVLSLSHVMLGVGFPVISQEKVAGCPSITVTLCRGFVKSGAADGTVSNRNHFNEFIKQLYY